VHERVSVNALAFGADPIETIVAKFRELSPRLVSFVSPQITGDALPVAKKAVADAGWGVATMTHIFTAGQLSDKAVWGPARASLSQAIKDGATVGAKTIYLITGGRGGLTWEEAAEAFAEAVAPCREEAKAAGIHLLIEPAPILYANMHLAFSLRDTVLLAEIADLGVCIDVFPIWPEAGLQETINRAGPRIGLVQVGDYVFGDKCVPARAIVGEGAIPMKRLFGWILETGFKGDFDLEMLGPRIEAAGPVEALRRSADKTGEILQALGA
jgi:sugar phosphate isomerase/epimerase